MSNIEKIRQEIDRLKNNYLNRSYTFVPVAMQQLLEFIDSLPEEKSSLPDNLYEAAKKLVCTEYPPYYEMPDDNWKERAGYVKGFKAGAEWLTEQGVSTIAISSAEDGITDEGMKLIADYLESLPDKTEVVLQIRKK